MAVLAALPIVTILVLMLVARWPAARAGVAGAGLTAVLAVLAFGFGTSVQPHLGAAGALGGALLEALWVTTTILWIVLPALCIHQLQERTRATLSLRDALGALTGDPRLLAVLVAWFFALFLEGAAGFGTPVALAAPFLVGVGFGRVQAVTLALVGHAIGVSFGAVGTPVLPQIAVTGLSGLEIARATGEYHTLLGWVMLVALATLVSRSRRARGRPMLQLLPWLAAAAALFLLPFWAVSRWLGPELPTLLGALCGGLAFAALLRWRGGQVAASPEAAADPVGQPSPSLLRAAAPYLVVVAVILLTRLVPPLRESLTALRVEWSLAGVFAGSVQPLYHPGTALFAGFLLGARGQRASGSAVAGAMGDALRRLAPVTVALVAMLVLARVMVHAGMVDVLARSTAALAGGAWPLLAPSVGALGTFVTGSATASNILLTDFQTATARALDLPLLPLVAAQGFGAAVGNIVCPHNIIAGGATVGLQGREGEVLRRTLLPCLVYAALGGALAFLLVR